MIPTVRVPDLAPAFLLRGYLFVGWHCDRLRTDAFLGRLLGRRTLFLRGPQAAALLYTPGLFPRPGAIPRSAARLLQDEDSVQTLEGSAHTHRKALFLALGSPERAAGLADEFERGFADALPRWRAAGRVRLHRELVDLLGSTVLSWSGIDLPAREARLRSRELGSMVEHAGSIGPPNWAARLRRRRTEAWARSVVRALREDDDAGSPAGPGSPAAGSPAGPGSPAAGAPAGPGSPAAGAPAVDGPGSPAAGGHGAGSPAAAEAPPAAAVALHRDASGALLPVDVAAVELLNVLRPVVAVARFLAFAAVALDARPDWAERLRAGDPADVANFAQEVRRSTPFFPVVAGIAARDFAWDGQIFEAGTRAVVDLYGTNMDPRSWPAPRAFDPDRFRSTPHPPEALVPQGAGDARTGHRCPGEGLTLALVERAGVLFARSGLRLPVQDLSVDLRRLPALPASGVVAVFD